MGSPLLFTDPTGASGEPVFEKENKRVVVHMTYNFYGGGSNQDVADEAAERLEAALNKNATTTVGPDGNEYPLVFEVIGLYKSEADAIGIMKSNIGSNFDARQNFVRVEGDASVATIAQNSTSLGLNFDSATGKHTGKRMTNLYKSSDNSIFISTTRLATTSWIHEAVSHGFNGRISDSHISDWSQNESSEIPSMGVTVQTKNVPDNLKVNGVFNRAFREVLPQDKNFRINWNHKNRKVGGATNTFFTAKAKQVTF
jgi:hypothetical protein